jgi:hypothetical protein
MKDMGDGFAYTVSSLWVLDYGANWMLDDGMCRSFARDTVPSLHKIFFCKRACRRWDVTGTCNS